MKIDEIAGAINFWIAADGKEYRLTESHVTWAAQRAGIALPTSRDDPAYWPAQASVYKFMFSRGWMRTAIDHAPRYMYVENMVNSRHKLWVYEQSKRHHLLAQDTQAQTICDFRAQEPKQESHEGRDLLLNLSDVDLPGYEKHVENDGTELYVKTLPNGVTVDVFSGTKEAKWDCAIALRDKTGHRVAFVIYPQREALLTAVAEVEAAASDPITADHAGLELSMKYIRSKYRPGIDETRQLARRMVMAARGPAAYAARLLEAPPEFDARSFILSPDVPTLRFVHSTYQGEHVFVDTGKPPRMNDWPQPIGSVVQTPDKSWMIVLGRYKTGKVLGNRWVWWENAPDEIRALRFPTKEEAGVKLWSLMKDKYTGLAENAPPDLRDWMLDQPTFNFHPYGSVMLVLIADQPRAKFLGGPKQWPRSLGMIRPDGEQWVIVHGSFNKPKLPDELKAMRFDTREAAAFELWKLSKDPEPVVESKLEPQPDRDVFTAYVETGLCPICESSRWAENDSLCTCANCHSKWKEVYENQELVGIVETEGVNVRDFILANPGQLTYSMRAYDPDNEGYRLAYDYDFSTFDAALRAALHQNQNFYVEIEAWDLPDKGQANLQNLWVVTQNGEVKEASPERRAEVAADKAAP